MIKLRFFGIALGIITTQNLFAKDTIESIGDITQIMVPVYAAGMAMNENDWTGIIQLATSFGSMQITSIGLKSIVNEKRPDGSDYNSFPSGHTASAFSGATFIHKRYGIKRAIIPYIAATFTGYSRVYADKHYIHDVLAGAAIAGLFTLVFTDKENSVRLSGDTTGARIDFNMKF